MVRRTRYSQILGDEAGMLSPAYTTRYADLPIAR